MPNTRPMGACAQSQRTVGLPVAVPRRIGLKIEQGLFVVSCVGIVIDGRVIDMLGLVRRFFFFRSPAAAKEPPVAGAAAVAS